MGLPALPPAGASGAAPARAAEMRQIIDALEQRQRDQGAPSGKPVWGPWIEQVEFVRVRALARFWAAAEHPGAPPVDYAQHMGDLLAGLHGAARTFSSLLLSTGDSLGVYLALAEAGAPSPLLRPALTGVYPGIELDAQPGVGVGKPAYQAGVFACGGMLTGIPTSKLSPPPPQEGAAVRAGVAQQIERLVRGLQGKRWALLVRADAVPPTTAAQLAWQGQDQLTHVGAQVRQQTSQQAARKEVVNGQVVALSSSVDQTNYDAKAALALLEKNLARLTSAKAEGLWQVSIYYFGGDAATRDQAAALLRAIFAGEQSSPEPVRTHTRTVNPQLPGNDGDFSTLLTSRELATLCQPPRIETPGYALRDYARFDTDPPPLPVAAQPSAPQQPVVTLGEVLDGGHALGRAFVLPRRDFTKHTFVAGITGSGKTTTVFGLLDQLHDGGAGVPFLVIEPAKTEYRALLHARSRFPTLRIYTLGDERYAPFRLNPFAFAIGRAPSAPGAPSTLHARIHVQTHIDFLKAVFNAAFVLYAPMPYVLETCLHEIYTDRGWDLASGLNHRLPPHLHGSEEQWPVFPTLGDLYAKIDDVVNRLGYEQRISMDVKAGLKARIGSLRLGGKGFMLDCAHSLPLRELLAHPTVLEMAAVGNEDEKSFMLGLLLTALYEHRIVEEQLRAAQPAAPGAAHGARGLVHLTVIEEAHRLLKNVSTQVDTESSNMRGQAVETFTNMLSEIRAYGEGVLIAEQIPAKLAPDAIKNTNLKIIHRLLAGDDRATLAATMNMDEEQSRYLTTLRAGQGVVFAEGADHPYLLAFSDPRAHFPPDRPTDAAVAAHMRPLATPGFYDPVPGYSALAGPPLQALLRTDATRAAVRTYAQTILAHTEFASQFSGWLLGAVEQPAQAAASFSWLRRLAQQVWIDATLLPAVAYHAVLAAVQEHAAQRGPLYRWPYDRIAAAYAPLQRAVALLAQEYPYTENDPARLQQAVKQLGSRIQTDLLQFQPAYAALVQAPPPYAACRLCTQHCRYRVEAERCMEQDSVRKDLNRALDETDDQAMWHALLGVCVDGARTVVRVARAQLPKSAVVCCALHGARALGQDTSAQLTIVRNLESLL